jgi:hypothetical protein
MPFPWYRDYSDKSLGELRQMAGRIESSERSELVKELMTRDARRSVAIVILAFVLAMAFSFWRHYAGM